MPYAVKERRGQSLSGLWLTSFGRIGSYATMIAPSNHYFYTPFLVRDNTSDPLEGLYIGPQTSYTRRLDISRSDDCLDGRSDGRLRTSLPSQPTAGVRCLAISFGVL